MNVVISSILSAIFFITLPTDISAQKTETKSLTVNRLLKNVRKVVGYNKIKNLKHGFTVEEIRAEPDKTGGFIFMFGAKGGKIRRRALSPNPNPFVFDGKYGWLTDAKTGQPTPPIDQRSREKILFPLWIRSGWWLDNDAPLNISVLPDESTEKQVALSIKFKGGLVGSKMFIDRATWLPAKFVVEYESGPYTLELKDYQEKIGFRYPHEIEINYRNATTAYKVKSIAAIEALENNAFAPPPLPQDTKFDNSMPADLKVAKAEGEGAHRFVRPLVDGRDVGWFLFDTGFGSMVIDTKFADELGMPILDTVKVSGSDGRVRTGTIRRGKTFQLGRVTMINPIYYAEDLSGKVAPPGEKRSGLVGYPLFARVVAEFAQGGERIAIYDPANYKLSKGRWQELFFVEHEPAVPARLEGNREGLFVLDTGMSGTVIFNSRYTKDQRLLERREVKESDAQGSGGGYKLLLGSVKWFELAGYRFQDPVAEFFSGNEGKEIEGRAGIVGRDFMSPFTVVFNYPERRIALIR